MSDLLAALRAAGVADADDSTLARALYSADASLYRVVPQVVARPRDTSTSSPRPWPSPATPAPR